MPKLNDEQAQAQLAQLDGWQRNAAGEITKTYTFTGFPQALMFATAVGVLAEAAHHHPDIIIKWNKVTLNLITHDAGGLTDKDFALARQIDTSLPH